MNDLPNLIISSQVHAVPIAYCISCQLQKIEDAHAMIIYYKRLYVIVLFNRLLA